MRPCFPVYVPSKGRHAENGGGYDGRLVTSRELTEMGIPHFLIVEPQEADAYRASVERLAISATVLELDHAYKARFECCDGLGRSKGTGSGPARNFAWDHSTASGAEWHWVMDDNIWAFCRLNRNTKIKLADGAGFRVMEDFCLRYANVAMAGPNYEHFVKRKFSSRPFVLNTRIYSCNLIRNDVPFRWRGRYNEDTILSLDMLKAGWVTVQFNAFLQNKAHTTKHGGGNTDEFYATEGTLPKSEMLVAVHGDVARLVWKFNRWHHHVDYSRFRRNVLIRRPGIVPSQGDNEYGMRLVESPPPLQLSN